VAVVSVAGASVAGISVAAGGCVAGGGVWVADPQAVNSSTAIQRSERTFESDFIHISLYLQN
jgi:hypothetical protein